MLRAYLFEAANVMLIRTKQTSALKTWGMEIAARSRGKKGARHDYSEAGEDSAPDLVRWNIIQAVYKTGKVKIQNRPDKG